VPTACAAQGQAVIAEGAAALDGMALLRWGAHRAILHGLRAPRVRHAAWPDTTGLASGAVRQVHIDGPRGRQLFAWLVRAPAAAAAGAAAPVPPAPAVLVMHGWGSNAAEMWPVVQPLHAAGFAVLLIDARCHGLSDGEAYTSMPRFAEDIAAGLRWLRAQPGIAGDRIALLGHSVGAGAALLHAARHGDVRAVLSLSAFAHPHEVMRRFMAAKRLPYPVLGWYVLRHVQRVIGARFDDIAPLHTLARVRCPVLLVHGRDDRTVPYTDAQRLQACAAHATLLPVDGDHDLRNSLAPHGPALVHFLRAALG